MTWLRRGDVFRRQKLNQKKAWRRPAGEKSHEKPLDIAIIIPFKDNSEMTSRCVHTLIRYGPPVLEVILISNNSSRTELKKIRRNLKGYKNVSIYSYDIPFNFQQINNWAVNKSTAKYLLFVNNDIELVEQSRGVIQSMLLKARDSGVGAVGTLLLYGDRKNIQHAGVYLEPGGMASHLYMKHDLNEVEGGQGATEQYDYPLFTNHPVTAVTAAFCLVKKAAFISVGGFDENFIIGGGDVDLCIRLNAAGYQSWYVAPQDSYIIHKEKQSRSAISIPDTDYYWSYRSYIHAFDLKNGDVFSPVAAKRKDENILKTDYAQNRPIERIRPTLPLLEQEPTLNFLSLTQKTKVDLLASIVKVAKEASRRNLGLRLLLNTDVVKADIEAALEYDKVKFMMGSTSGVLDLPIHPNDLFYSSEKVDSAIINTLPVNTKVNINED